MRRLFASALLLLLIICAPAFGQERDLQLTIGVVNQASCRANAGTDMLQLTLKLRYTNAGSRKLILYRGNRLFYQVFVSRSREDALARRFEMYTTHSRYFDEQPEKISAAHPGGVFVTLPPGASYETRQVIAVPVAREAASRVNVAIPPGEHVVNIVTSTWYESRKLAEELRERWSPRGFLWVDPVGSDFAAFTVDNVRAAAVCQ
ncbi:MAG TPA: hypothetical protein VJT09_17650 [Pyrinomonadaceae bacterium]|nr:hypothetical protein [Pyrinomonadaceae bacterium]